MILACCCKWILIVSYLIFETRHILAESIRLDQSIIVITKYGPRGLKHLYPNHAMSEFIGKNQSEISAYVGCRPLSRAGMQMRAAPIPDPSY